MYVYRVRTVESWARGCSAARASRSRFICGHCRRARPQSKSLRSEYEIVAVRRGRRHSRLRRRRRRRHRIRRPPRLSRF